MSAKNCVSLMKRVHTLHKQLNLNNYAILTSSPSAQLWRLYSTTEKSAPKEQLGETAQTVGSDAPVDAAAYDKLRKDFEEKCKQSDELMDKYKRALAESENMRRRLEKRIEDTKAFGIQSFGKDMLEVADNLGNATAAVKKEKLDSNPELKDLYDGLEMTKASLLQIFKRHGLEPMNPLNEKFNPNYHEALFQKVDPTVEPNTVVEVTKMGYKLRDRCLRPALVGVSKAS